MKYNIPERLVREIREIAQKNGINKVILFGSRARGTNTERSDIDIAVSGGNHLNFCSDVEEYTHTLLMFDIVDLDGSISPDLQSEIERDGITLYEKA